MQTFLKPFKKLAGRVLLGLFKPNKTLLLVF
jgi:hypothetical protein